METELEHKERTNCVAPSIHELISGHAEVTEGDEMKQLNEHYPIDHSHFDRPVPQHIRIQVVLYIAAVILSMVGIVGSSWWVFLNIVIPNKCGENCTIQNYTSTALRV